MKTFDLETREGRHEFYKYALEIYKEKENDYSSYIDVLPLCPFFEGLLIKSNYVEKIPCYDEYVTICLLLPEFFAKKPEGVLPRAIWWKTYYNPRMFYEKRISILEELVEETK